MKIVIEISEEEYKCVQLTGHIGNVTAISNAILNSTPLPKHYGRLIDADALLKNHPEFDTYPFPSTTIINAPTIIPATKEKKSCKNCEHGFDSEDCYKCDKNIQNTCEPMQTATKEDTIGKFVDALFFELRRTRNERR